MEFNDLVENNSGNHFLEVLFPETMELEGYKIIFDSQFPVWVRNSVVVAMIVTLLNLLFNTMAGYALARIILRDVISYLMGCLF